MANTALIDPVTGKQIDVPDFLRPSARQAAAAPTAPQDQPSLLGGALRAGWNETQAVTGGAVGALGSAVGLQGLADYGAEVYQRNNQEAARYGRPDLEVAPWREGGASTLPWLAYQATKMVPLTLGTIAAGAVAAAALPETAAGAALATGAGRGLAYLPKLLGGGGLRFGAGLAERKAAQQVGTEMAKKIGNLTVGGYAPAVGSLYGEAIDRGDPSRTDALLALAEGVPYAAMEAFLPRQLEEIAVKGSAGGLMKRITTAGVAGALTEMPTEALQTAMEMSFRPDLTMQEKMNNILDAALTGAAAGGVLSGTTGAASRAPRGVDPNAITSPDLAKFIDGMLGDQQQLPGMEITRPEAEQMKQRVDEQQTAKAGPSRDMLMNQLSILEQRAVAGKDTAQDRAQRAALQQRIALMEEADRTASGETAAPNPNDAVGNLFGELPTQVRETPSEDALNTRLPGDVAPEVVAMRDKARKLAGGKAKWIDTLEVTDDVGLVDAVMQRLDAQATDATTVKTAQKLGLVDEKMQPRDLTAELKVAESKLEIMWERAKAGVGLKQAQEMQKRVAELRTQKELLDRVGQRRAEAAAAPVTPPGTALTVPNQTGMEPTALVPPAPQAPAPQGQIGQQTNMALPAPDTAPLALPAPAPLPTANELLGQVTEANQAAQAAGETPTAMGERMQQALQARTQADAAAAVTQQRQAEFDAAEGQRLEQRFKAEVSASAEPVVARGVVNVPQEGQFPRAAVRLSQGPDVVVEERRDAQGNKQGWFDLNGQFLGRSLNEVRGTVVERANADRDMAPVVEEAKALDKQEIRDRRGRTTIRYMRKRLMDRMKGDKPTDFMRRFGASKVVDENGNPLLVYHGTNSTFDRFSKSALGKATGAPSAKQGFFFSSSASVASSYAAHWDDYQKLPITRFLQRITKGGFGRLNDKLNVAVGQEPWQMSGGNVRPVYLSIVNPKIVDYNGSEYREQTYNDVIVQAKAEGYDGVILRDTIDEGFMPGGEMPSDVYVAFEPSQIISAFDVDKPSRQTVVEAVARVTANWTAKLDISVVNDKSELPESVRRMMRGEGVDDALGIVDEAGRVYLIANNLRSVEEAVSVLYHETLGHVGLKEKFGTRLDSILLEAYRSNPEIKRLTDQWMETFPDGYKGPDQVARAVEEVFANKSMDGPIDATLWQKIVALVKDFARQMGIKVSMSDSEVSTILAMSHELIVKRGIKQGKSQGLRYIYAGQKSIDNILDDHERQGMQSALDYAKYLDAEGIRTPDDIRNMTGWFKGRYDKKWRFEVPDHRAALLPAFEAMSETDKMPLEKLLHHPALFELYPMARYIEVSRKSVDGDINRTIHGSQGGNRINVAPYADDPLKTLVHELQHWVQDREGFATGGNANMAYNALNAEQKKRARSEVAFLQSRTVDNLKGQLKAAEYVANKEGITSSVVKDLRTKMAKLRKAGKDKTTDMLNAFEEAAIELYTAYTGAAPEVTDSIFFRLKDAVHDAYNNMPYDTVNDLKVKIRNAENLMNTFKTGTDEAVSDALRDSAFARTLYTRLAGEIEARDVENRLRMGVKDRAENMPFNSEQISPERAILSFDTAGPSNSVANTLTQLPQIVKVAGEKLANVQKEVDTSGAKTGMFAKMLEMSTIGHIASMYDKFFGGALKAYSRSHQLRTTLEQRLSDLSMQPYRQYERLPQAAREGINFLMGMTEFGIDPAKTAEQQDWINNEPNADILKAHARKANNTYTTLKRNGNLDAYLGFKSVNEAMHFAQQAVSLYNLVQTNPDVAKNIPAARENPMVAFLQTSSLQQQPAVARDYWKAAVDALMRDVEKFVTEQRTTSTADADKKLVLTSDLSSAFGERLVTIKAQQAAMMQAPYFHLGRFGNYFVAFDIRQTTDPNGKKVVDNRAVQAIAKRLDEAGFKGVTISEGNGRWNVFVRNESQTQNENLYKLAVDLQKEGYVSADREVKRGKRDEAFDGYVSQQWMTQLMQAMETSPQFQPTEDMSPEQRERLNKSKKAMLGQLRDYMMDLLPDTSISKVMTHRDSVPGYTSDMVRSYAFRTQLGAHSLANMTAAAFTNEAMVNMRNSIAASKVDSSNSNVYKKQAIYQEIMTREGNRSTTEGRTWHDTFRAFNHAYFLGMSPAYALVNMTQIGALLWPELAKKHGFVKSAKAIGRVTNLAMKVVAATLKEGIGLGLEAAPDATITEAALKRAGVSEKDAKFILMIVNTGVIDIGSASREHTRVSEDKMGSKVDLGLRMASSLGYYSELSARLIAALAARDLHGGADSSPELRDYVVNTVDESMFNYATWQISRFSSKNGFAGKMTPLMLSFMQFSMQYMEKLYREVHKAITKDATPTEKAEARRFLGAHLAAMTVLAGSLGLPGASIVAMVAEQLLGDDDEPYDAKAAWRNFLADMFGKDVGEVLARGLPRAIGVDISARAGAADVIPFTKLLTDKRSWQDALEGWAADSLGSPFGMLSNIVMGGSAIADGNVLEGMKTMMPVALKGPIEAYRMTENGYVDKNGVPLPMTPGANDILVQLLGFGPAAKAEYTEARGMQTARRGILSRTASNIRKNLADAIEAGDTDKAREWLTSAREFDAANPTQPILPGMTSYLKARLRKAAEARITGTPLGTRYRDPAATAMTSFANF